MAPPHFRRATRFTRPPACHQHAQPAPKSHNPRAPRAPPGWFALPHACGVDYTAFVVGGAGTTREARAVERQRAGSTSRGVSAAFAVLALAARRSLAALALAATLAACSLLAPSSDSLSGEYLDDAGASEASTPRPDAPCGPGTKRCAGACVAITSAATGCAGPSCEPCQAAHATPICVAGACALGPCENGWANCNAAAADGCETDTRSSSAFCGSCLTSCGQTTPRCEQGACVPRCHAIRFTQAAAHISVPTAGMELGAGDFTVELWFAIHTDYAPAEGYLFASNETFVASSVLVFSGGGSLFFAISSAQPDGTGTLKSALPTDTAWHHVAGVRRGGIATLYVDGTARAQEANTNAVILAGPAALGKPSGYPSYTAHPTRIGPTRISRVARYAGAFTPRTFWPVDADTVAQYLTSRGFDGVTLHDEAGGDNNGVADLGVISNEDTPCP